MAEWLVEEGIGEQRAIMVEGGEVVAAKLRRPDELFAGKHAVVQLVSKPSGAQRGLAVDELGNEILLDRLPPELTEGQRFGVEVTRAPIAEKGRYKRTQARVLDEAEGARSGPDDVFTQGDQVQRFQPGLWDEVWTGAWDGRVEFAGGNLLFAATPAMTVVDIDGELAPRELALAAVPALARALRMFDIGGSVGIDFPTLADKADRKAVDAALAEALADWPHERTAMNGFGLVQLVARLEGPSLLQRLAGDRAGSAARLLLRRAEAVSDPGAILLTCHPAVRARLTSEWLDELARRTGREIRIASDPALALEAGFAQAVAR